VTTDNWPLFLDRRFLDEHYGYFVADRINKCALRIKAFQTRLLVIDLKLRSALRAAKDL